jgi:outer membrane protein OmpA-like peptidoglycan-associated protein
MTKSLHDVSTLHVPPPQVRTRLERAAEAAAASTERGPLHPGPVRNTMSPERSFEGGQPLAVAHRAPLEARMGADFSRVRVHADTQASEAADALGARAFTYGGNIVFGSGQFAPHTETGGALLAHELMHTVQQAQSGESALQMEGKDDQPAGAGAQAPKEDVAKATKPAPEDGFALFAFDSAELNPAEQQKLLSSVSTHKSAVTITVHGYASSEGTSEYNDNLASQRAASVKKFLESNTPAGSKVLLVSHGETTAFGPVERNRRAGISIQDSVPDSAPAKKDDGWTFDPTGGKKAAPVDLGLTQPGGGSGPVARQYALKPIIPPLGPPLGPVPTLNDIDWESITGKFRLRGQNLQDRDIDSITEQWNYSYHFFRAFAPHDWAVKGANLAVPYAVDTWIAGQYPNAYDRAQAEFSKAYPTEKHIVIPVISSDILDKVRMWLLDKKKDDHYFRF